jgi:hypothetical protein
MQKSRNAFGRVIAGIMFGVCISGFAWGADDSDIVGSITSLEGDVSILRNGEIIVPQKGTQLHKTDLLKTGRKSSVGAVLRDATTISLGSKSQLVLEEFEFEPAENLLGVTLRMVKGTLACLTGRIAKLSPDAFKVETPVATVGVRGTKFVVEVR